MKVTVALLVICLAVASARNLDFALEYRGECVHDGRSGHCNLKAQSQQITTRIRGTGEVDTSVDRLLGSISKLEFGEVFNVTSGTYVSRGSMSFGAHQNSKDHKIEFRGDGSVRNSPNPDRELVFSTIWVVTKGYGTFEKALGTITANGVWDRQTKEAVVGVVGIIWYSA